MCVCVCVCAIRVFGDCVGTCVCGGGWGWGEHIMNMCELSVCVNACVCLPIIKPMQGGGGGRG